MEHPDDKKRNIEMELTEEEIKIIEAIRKAPKSDDNTLNVIYNNGQIKIEVIPIKHYNPS